MELKKSNEINIIDRREDVIINILPKPKKKADTEDAEDVEIFKLVNQITTSLIEARDRKRQNVIPNNSRNIILPPM